MVYFKIAGGEIVPEIEMSLSETILDLKQKIQKELDVKIHRQSLWHHNRMLRDNEYIKDFDFLHTSETVLNINVTPLPPQQNIHVLVKSLGSNGYVMVKETDRVSVLRNVVERYWGTPSNRVTLRRCNVVMEDHLPLSAYYVNEGSEVQLSISIQPR